MPAGKASSDIHPGLRHLFVTQDYGPDSGGMARRHVELCRRFSNEGAHMSVSTVAHPNASAFDGGEHYPIHREPFPFHEAKLGARQLQWAVDVVKIASKSIDIIHCGNLRPSGYSVLLSQLRLRKPYMLYVNGGDLLKEIKSAHTSARKRITGRQIVGRSSGIVATSDWVAELSSQLCGTYGLKRPPPIRAIGLGTDPDFFREDRDKGEFRRRYQLGDCPLLLTVARLVPHKGQDVVIQALPKVLAKYPDVRYAIIGSGPYESNLKQLARQLGVLDSVIFAGALADEEIADAYATATIYVGLSRIEQGIDAEGFGIAFLEAAASGLPSIAGDSGGVRSAVRDGVGGILVDPTDVHQVGHSIAELLENKDQRQRLGRNARNLVETRYNWDRVAHETLDFTLECVGRGARRVAE